MTTFDPQPVQTNGEDSSTDSGELMRLEAAIKAAGFDCLEAYMAVIGNPRDSVGLKFTEQRQSNIVL